MTISFSYAYLKGLDLLIVSSPWVHISVHLPSLAISPRITNESQLDLEYTRIGSTERTIHQDSLSDIICIMTSHDMVYVQHSGASV